MRVLRRQHSEELDLTHYSRGELEALALRQRELDRTLRAPTRDPRILRRQDLGPGPLEGIPTRGGGGRYTPPGLFILLVADDGVVQAGTAFAGAATGTITKAGSTCTLADAGVFAGLAGRAKGSTISLRGWSAGNNGDFTIANCSVGSAVNWDNPAGLSEAAPVGSSYSTLPCVESVVDRASGFAFTSPAPVGNTANAFARNTTLLPGKTVWGMGLTTGNAFNCKYLECVNVNALTPILSGGQPLSLALYVFNTSPSSGVAWWIWRDQPWGVASTRYARWTNQAASLFWARVGTSSTTYNVPAVATASVWQTLIFTFDGSTAANAAKMYIDGTLAATDTTARALANIASLASVSLTSITNAVGATPGSTGTLGGIRAASVALTGWDAATVAKVDKWLRAL